MAFKNECIRIVRLVQSNNCNSYYPRVIVQLKLSSFCFTAENFSRLLCTQERRKYISETAVKSANDVPNEQFLVQ